MRERATLKKHEKIVERAKVNFVSVASVSSWKAFFGVTTTKKISQNFCNPIQQDSYFRHSFIVLDNNANNSNNNSNSCDKGFKARTDLKLLPADESSSSSSSSSSSFVDTTSDLSFLARFVHSSSKRNRNHPLLSFFFNSKPKHRRYFFRSKTGYRRKNPKINTAEIFPIPGNERSGLKKKLLQLFRVLVFSPKMVHANE